jgi:hypothetical protein
MKRNLFLISTILIALNANSQITVLSSGYVGINNSSPTHNLDVQGPVHFGQWLNCCSQTWEQVIIDWNNQYGAPQLYPASDAQFNIGLSSKRVGYITTYAITSNNYWNASDEKVKENIQPLHSTLSRLMKVNGKTYNFKKLTGENIKMPINTSKTFGFIAQELKNTFPELVREPDSMNTTYSVNYVGMIPVLVEAIKEQQIQIDSLKQLLSKSTSSLKNTSDTSILKAKSTLSLAGVALHQNSPNPFNQSTTIGYYLPESVNNPVIYIYDMNGTQIKSYSITERGNGSIAINSYELKPGMYLYTLIANGQEIATKRMILTQ